MRGISEERLIDEMKLMFHLKETERGMCIQGLIDQCKELNTRMTLEEFLKSGFEGWCWITFDHGAVNMSLYRCNEFYFNADTDYTYCKETILKVQPIHKPEPPKL